MSRLSAIFERTKSENRAAFISFLTAGDPDGATSIKLVEALADAGSDIIELGMPFSDPSADGPAIERASGRALKTGGSIKRTLEIARIFRKRNNDIGLVAMGYFNPLLAYGLEQFIKDTALSGIDGLIIVDLPPEEDEELRTLAQKAGIDNIRLATPTSDKARLTTILDGASGFLYYVSVAGITGQKSAESQDLKEAIARITSLTDLPIAIGFGIKTPEQAREAAQIGDAVVVGSALVNLIEEGLKNALPHEQIIDKVSANAQALANSIHTARQK